MANAPKKVLLLENIHSTGRDLFIRHGFDVEALKNSAGAEELKQKLKSAQILGIRSKTQITEDILRAAPNLECLGCFCVGTNQVDLKAANSLAVPVFNAPFSNTRSVAEMVIGYIVMLARQFGTRNNEMHAGIWNKESDGCFEIRGKTLGIVGYGNVGTQTSMLAEAMGMRVVFYDIVSKLTLGNAKPYPSLGDMLRDSDFVTLHVPATPLTSLMIGMEELRMMKKGAYLINASRGNVVEIEALAQVLKEKHLAGAALDVYPTEPEKKTDAFKSIFAGMSNVVMTPHIGGATEEAQANIGREVAESLIRFAQLGSTATAVNYPRIDPLPLANASTGGAVVGHRLQNTHRNVPGVLKEINRVVADSGANILSQSLSTDPEIGYLIMDLDRNLSEDALRKLAEIKAVIRTRILA